MRRDEPLSLRLLSGYEQMPVYGGAGFFVSEQDKSAPSGQAGSLRGSGADGFFSDERGTIGRDSQKIRKRVEQVQMIQRKRYQKEKIQFTES